MGCKCDMRTKLVGDGCEICNPELAAEIESENRICKCGHDIRSHEDYNLDIHECNECDCPQFCDC